MNKQNGSERINNDVPLLIGSTLNEFSTPKVDEMVRNAVIEQATIRCQDGGAPVYVYLSAYQTPTLDGRNHACHNSDITAEYYKKRPCAAKVESAARIFANYLRQHRDLT